MPLWADKLEKKVSLLVDAALCGAPLVWAQFLLSYLVEAQLSCVCLATLWTPGGSQLHKFCLPLGLRGRV